MSDTLTKMEHAQTKESVNELESGRAGSTVHVDLVPGTRTLLAGSSEDLILMPQPSEHPDDPLNWGSLRRYTSYAIVCIYSFMVATVALSTAVTYGALIAEFGTTAQYLNIGTAISLLLVGVGDLFWYPLALHYGRRPVYIASCLLTGVAQIISATAQTSSVFIGSRILMGFFAAPFEQLPAVSVNDQFFVHRRSYGITLYVLAATLGSFLGPMATGFVVDGAGWRWVHWIFAIIMGGVTVLAFFFLEETGYDRDVSLAVSSTVRSKPYTAKLSLITKLHPPQDFLNTMIEPLKLLVEPIVVWTAFLYGFGIAWLSIVAFTSNTIFQSPEYGYNFSFASVGLAGLATLVGSVLILYIGGAGTDRFMIWRAHKNNGVMEPESRIYAVFVAGPIMAAGLILYGAGAAAGLHWMVPITGMGLVGAGIPISGEVALAYVTECYSHKAGEASTAMITIRNIIACAMLFATEPWIRHNGLRDTFIIMGVLCLVGFWSGALLIWKGKSCRRRSARIWGLS